MLLEKDQQKIEQQMKDILLRDELLASLKIAFHENRMVVLLSPKGQVSSRVMGLCLDFLAGRVRVAGCAWRVETDRRIWVDCERLIGYTGVLVLAELIVLGLRLSESLVSSSPDALIDLVRSHRSKEDALSCYAQVVSQAIEQRTDWPTPQCDAALYAHGLCCVTHRWFFLHRLRLLRWLEHLLQEGEGKVREPRGYLLDPPALMPLMAALLEQTFTAQAFLEAYCAYVTRQEEERWYLRTPGCLANHHGSWLCCSFHLSMAAIRSLLRTWAMYFDGIYHMTEMCTKKHDEVGLCSPAWFALFIHLAHLDVTPITFPDCLVLVPTLDVNQYKRKNGSTDWGDSDDVQAVLRGLTDDEREVLTTIFHLFERYNYQVVADHDIYAAIPHAEYEDVHASLRTLREKRFIEMREGSVVTSIIITQDLSEQEKQVLVTIVDWMHAFKKAVDFRNLVGNMQEIAEDELRSLLVRLAQFGLVTITQDYTVSATFQGTNTLCQHHLP